MEHLPHTMTDAADQADEEFLTSTLSDEAMEAAADVDQWARVSWTGVTLLWCACGSC